MRVRYTPRARADLAGILAYIDARSPSEARNVKLALKKTIDLVGEHPAAGRLVGEEDVRVLPVGRHPYLIYWKVERREVWIVHIRHAARQRPQLIKY